jgi:hypothetical protein
MRVLRFNQAVLGQRFLPDRGHDITDLKAGDCLSYLLHDTDRFMSHDYRKGAPQLSVVDMNFPPAETTRQRTKPQPTRTGLGNFNAGHDCLAYVSKDQGARLQARH